MCATQAGFTDTSFGQLCARSNKRELGRTRELRIIIRTPELFIPWVLFLHDLRNGAALQQPDLGYISTFT